MPAHDEETFLSHHRFVGAQRAAPNQRDDSRGRSTLRPYNKSTCALLALLIIFIISGPALAQTAPVTVDSYPLSHASVCSGQFVAHDLDHVTRVPSGETVRMFEANGSGVAINDLDNDGDLDIVLGNHAGTSTLLWNEGDLTFRTEKLAQSDTRAVTSVDVDGDGWLDLVFSHNKLPPAYWRNIGGRFVRQYLSGVGKPLYAINWGDVDEDGDLDLVGASYDASLLTDYGQSFITDGKGGVSVYTQQDEIFKTQALATSAQGLALMLLDLNGDDHLDIWVGNDFAVPDQVWHWSADGWQPAPLTAMSYSTMSLDAGDIDNDGRDEVLSTDMKSMGGSSAGEQALRAVTDDINAGRDQTVDPQITANVLQAVGGAPDEAESMGLDATGWSWSGKFGDLDQDGLLDVYIVNGFIEAGTFRDLPNQELVQANQVFRNQGTGRFVPMPEWDLGSERSGRGMSMGDLDGDGDLDLVVNNLNSAAQLFENQLCTGHSLHIDLLWSDSDNTRAIGARLRLITDQATYTRDVRAASGYLSGDPSRVHFGLPEGVLPAQLEIRWPDSAVSLVAVPDVDARLVVTRGE